MISRGPIEGRSTLEVRNVMEELVRAALSEELAGAAEVCACDRCRVDMQAFALNNLPPRYVVDEPGAVHAHLEVLTATLRGDIRYSVRSAVQLVSARPRHARSRVGRRPERE